VKVASPQATRASPSLHHPMHRLLPFLTHPFSRRRSPGSRRSPFDAVVCLPVSSPSPITELVCNLAVIQQPACASLPVEECRHLLLHLPAHHSRRPRAHGTPVDAAVTSSTFGAVDVNLPGLPLFSSPPPPFGRAASAASNAPAPAVFCDRR
jgi:hypothetical protein